MTQKLLILTPMLLTSYASVVSTISENLNKEKPKQVPVFVYQWNHDPIVPYKGGMISGNKVAVGQKETVKQWS